MIPALIDARQRLRTLEGEVAELKAIVVVQQGVVELLTMRGDMMSAHIENLIERVAELEPGNFGTPCTCGWGGQHDPDNPRCDRNQERLLPTQPEPTSTGIPVSPLSPGEATTD